MKKKGLQTVWLMLVVAFLYLPILILAVYSFTKSTMIGSIRGFSVHNYVTLFTTKELTDMIIGTVGSCIIQYIRDVRCNRNFLLFQKDTHEYRTRESDTGS